MPTDIAYTPGTRRIKLTDEQIGCLSQWLRDEISTALSNRAALEESWCDDLRQYHGVPKMEARNVPIENAPNIEVELGAIAADIIYAQVIDLIYNTDPLVTVRPVPKKKADKEAQKNAAAMQRFVNHIAERELDLRTASESALLDNVQLGTGILYIPWVQRIVKGARMRVTQQGPQVRSVPIEDYLTPGGPAPRWTAIRFWLTKSELHMRANKFGWDIEGVEPAPSIGKVRRMRESLGRQRSGDTNECELYEVLDVYARYDIDEDDIDEDLLVTFERHTGKVLRVVWNPYDKEPLAIGVYQRLGHLPYGKGVLAMLHNMEEEATDLHNYMTLNLLLANSRIWLTKMGVMDDDTPFVPGAKIPTSDPSNDVKALEMADIYPSLPAAQSMLMALAQQRTGINDLNSAGGNMLGNRTPGITALSVIQQVNKRFTPVFDGVQKMLSEALVQCVMRYSERVQAEHPETLGHIMKVLGNEGEAGGDGGRVIRILIDPDFNNEIIVELTASSVSTNKEADRQNMLLLISTMTQYYTQIFGLVQLAAAPTTPTSVRDFAQNLAEKFGDLVEKTLRTFDQIRDPDLFVLDVQRTFNMAANDAGQAAMHQATAFMAQAQGMRNEREAALQQGQGNAPQGGMR